jgi:DNA-binding MarR family transcriptional regulator
MSSVKRASRRTRAQTPYDEHMRLDDYEPKHLAYLMDRLAARQNVDIWQLASQRHAAAAHEGLTARHFRLLSMVPAGGARVTDLARVARVTKQALGQFVTFLEDRGYVESSPDPRDRRVRMVARTSRGDQAVRDTNELFARLERQWRRQVGAERWDTFRSVLVELATGWDPGERSVADPREAADG